MQIIQLRLFMSLIILSKETLLSDGEGQIVSVLAHAVCVPHLFVSKFLLQNYVIQFLNFEKLIYLFLLFRKIKSRYFVKIMKSITFLRFNPFDRLYRLTFTFELDFNKFSFNRYVLVVRLNKWKVQSNLFDKFWTLRGLNWKYVKR